MRTYAYKTFPPATDAEITQTEESLGTKLCDDYKDFLRTDNGLEINEDAPYDALGDWPNHVHRYFGISAQQLDRLDQSLDGFFDRRYLPICYPVGDDGGGNLMVQIAAGERRGQITMFDHEMWYGGMSDLLEVEGGYYPDQDEDETKRLPFDSFDQATPDQILDECARHGFISIYPITFAEHLASFDAHLNRIAQENRDRPKVPVPTTATLKAAYICLPVRGKWQAAEELSSYQGNRFVFDARDLVAWDLRLAAEETRPIQVRVLVTAPDGAVLRDTLQSFETNGEYEPKSPLHAEGGTAVSGTYRIQVSFPDDADLAPLEGAAEIVIGQHPLNFTSGRFDPATEEQIAALERDLPYRICDDYRAWLTGLNGVNLRWTYIDLWQAVSDAEFDACEAELKAVRNQSWELEVHEIFGLIPSDRVWNEYTDPPGWVELRRGLAAEFSLARGLVLNVLYPVAQVHTIETKGYSQIAAGARRGRIVKVKEKAYLLQNIDRIEDGKLRIGGGRQATTFEFPFRTCAEATPDQIIDAWIGHGVIEMTDMDFATFSARVIAANEAAFSRIYLKYLSE